MVDNEKDNNVVKKCYIKLIDSFINIMFYYNCLKLNFKKSDLNDWLCLVRFCWY